VFSDPLLFTTLVLLGVEIRLLNLTRLVDLLEMLIAQDDRIRLGRCDVVPRIVRARLLPPASEEGGSSSVAYMVRHEPIIASCDTRHQFLGTWRGTHPVVNPDARRGSRQPKDGLADGS
jgi:hypothetical protein